MFERQEFSSENETFLSRIRFWHSSQTDSAHAMRFTAGVTVYSRLHLLYIARPVRSRGRTSAEEPDKTNE